VPARSTVDDQDEVAGGNAQPRGMPGVEHGLDTREFREVVAAPDGSEARAEPAGCAVVGRIVVIEGDVEVGEPSGQLLRHRTLHTERENRDATTDVGTHQERVQHRRGHGRADRRALAGVQVRHSGDVHHAVERRNLVALVHRVGLDPARRRREHRDGGLLHEQPFH